MIHENSIHIGKEIKKVVDSQGRKYDWFAGQLNYERTNAYDIFQRQSINTDLLLSISRILSFDFFALYSASLTSPSQHSPS